jgi:DNA-binding XRE family transcriptional regulator
MVDRTPQESHDRYLATDPDYRAAVERMRPLRQLQHSLIQARLRAGLTQTEVARRAGISQPAYARIERGRHWPHVETIQKVANALGLSLTVTVDPQQAA